MCFDHDSRPPIAPIAGGALDSQTLILTADDRNRFVAFRARATEPTGAAIVILPDVRGLHPYYEELALRFAERGAGRSPSGACISRTAALMSVLMPVHVVSATCGGWSNASPRGAAPAVRPNQSMARASMPFSANRKASSSE